MFGYFEEHKSIFFVLKCRVIFVAVFNFDYLCVLRAIVCEKRLNDA